MRDDSYPVDQIDFVDNGIDNQHQLSLTLTDNTKVADDRSENYSFTCSVDFNRDSVEKITLRDASYPVHQINFGRKDTQEQG